MFLRDCIYLSSFYFFFFCYIIYGECQFFIAHFVYFITLACDTGFILCKYIFIATPKNPCLPSPCGPYSQCRPVDDHAVCSCQKDYIGIPPACRPECMVNSECPQDKACIRQKCSDPCPDTCAANARCQVVNHNPICSCAVGYTGDPFVRCVAQRKPPIIFLMFSHFLHLENLEIFLTTRINYSLRKQK